jgi:hypothetical protein
MLEPPRLTHLVRRSFTAGGPRVRIPLPPAGESVSPVLSAKQIVDAFVKPVTGDHLIGDAGNPRDLRWAWRVRIFEPLRRAENLVDPPVLTVIFEQADALTR